MRSFKVYRDSVNLLYLENVSGTKNGITYTWEGTKLTLNGTATADTDIYNFGWWGATTQNEKRLLKAGTYTYSTHGASHVNRFSINMFYNTSDVIGIHWKNETRTKTFEEDTYYANCYISILNGATFNNETFYLQLEEGSIVNEYDIPGEKIFVRDGFETFKESINANGKQITASFDLLGVPYPNNLIVKINPYFDSANSLLGSTMKCLEMEMEGLIPVVNDTKITNLKFGVKSDGEYDYINYGTYIVNKYEWDMENMSTTLLCYDKMVESMIPYDLTIDYSSGNITILDLLQIVCSRLGWTLGTTEFTNSNVIIDEEKYDKTYTFRSILEEIGQVAGGKIAFKDDDVLYVLYPTETNEIIDESNLKTLTIGKKYGPVNSLVISRTPQEDNIYRQDEELINAPGGKNLLNITSNGSSRNGITLTINNNKLILNGTATAYTEYYLKVNTINFVNESTYVLSLKEFGGIISGVNGETTLFNVVNGMYLKSPNASLKKTMTSDTSINQILIAISSGVSFDNYTYSLQLEESSIPTEYEPFTPQGVIEVKIENNQLIDSHREDFIDNLFDRLKGLTFYTYELESYGIGYLELYDVFTMKTHDDKEYSCLFLYDNFEITQGVSENSKADLPKETETDYKVASESDRVLNKTILLVDKQDQEIRALITSTQDINNEVNGIKGNYDTLTQKVEQTMTSTEVQTLITETITTGIDSVTTSTGYTFNKDGLHISKTGEEMENILDNTGMYVNRDDENILTANNDGVNAINLTSRQYLTIGDNSRLEDYLTNRTACFYVGGDN